jgi:hypothetical protein
MPTQQWRAPTKEAAEAYRNSRPELKRQWLIQQASEEMYEVLRATLAMIDIGDVVFVTSSPSSSDRHIAALRAALAKAEGRTS